MESSFRVFYSLLNGFPTHFGSSAWVWAILSWPTLSSGGRLPLVQAPKVRSLISMEDLYVAKVLFQGKSLIAEVGADCLKNPVDLGYPMDFLFFPNITLASGDKFGHRSFPNF